MSIYLQSISTVQFSSISSIVLRGKVGERPAWKDESWVLLEIDCDWWTGSEGEAAVSSRQLELRWRSCDCQAYSCSGSWQIKNYIQLRNFDLKIAITSSTQSNQGRKQRKVWRDLYTFSLPAQSYNNCCQGRLQRTLNSTYRPYTKFQARQ